MPLEDGGRRLTVTRTVGGKGSSASVNGCSVKVIIRERKNSLLLYVKSTERIDALFWRRALL